ncbi:CD70 antigen [Ornithorhynchus anatinus]|uniref:CD70 antigen n=1 Tax=Ornithorhynchus anatinus TaxID=9258 RepID=UPI0010A87AF2|nr:CD70 antigen [Ornithorhynchus anatinus]
MVGLVAWLTLLSFFQLAYFFFSLYPLAGWDPTLLSKEKFKFPTAHLLLNHSDGLPVKRLQWMGGAQQGRSFVQGMELTAGNLKVLQGGIYYIYIQVTLSNCSLGPERTLSIKVHTPQWSAKLLSHEFGRSCSLFMGGQFLLSSQDVLEVECNSPEVPWGGRDETFFGAFLVDRGSP